MLARFDPDRIAEFYIDDKLHDSSKFGLMELENVHYIHYIKASTIDDEGDCAVHILFKPMCLVKCLAHYDHENSMCSDDCNLYHINFAIVFSFMTIYTVMARVLEVPGRL